MFACLRRAAPAEPLLPYSLVEAIQHEKDTLWREKEVLAQELANAKADRLVANDIILRVKNARHIRGALELVAEEQQKRVGTARAARLGISKTLEGLWTVPEFQTILKKLRKSTS